MATYQYTSREKIRHRKCPYIYLCRKCGRLYADALTRLIVWERGKLQMCALPFQHRNMEYIKTEFEESFHPEQKYRS